jgi:hypothetical protein
MTDQERLLTLLKDFGVPCKTSDLPDDEPWFEPYSEHEVAESEGGCLVVIGDRGEYHRDRKVGGLSMFYGTWLFDKEGQFLKVGFWE